MLTNEPYCKVLPRKQTGTPTHFWLLLLW